MVHVHARGSENGNFDIIFKVLLVIGFFYVVIGLACDMARAPTNTLTSIHSTHSQMNMCVYQYSHEHMS